MHRYDCQACHRHWFNSLGATHCPYCNSPHFTCGPLIPAKVFRQLINQVVDPVYRRGGRPLRHFDD